MQIFHRIFLALLLAHLMADFPFQSSWIAANKGKRLPAIAIHAMIHFGLSVLIVVLFLQELSPWKVAAAALGLALLHSAQDIFKDRLIRHTPMRRFSTTVFLFDQGMHIAIISIVAFFLSGSHAADALQHVAVSGAIKDRILLVGVVYCGVVFGGGYFIRFVTRSLANSAAGTTTETSEDLKNAGLYIGWLERSLVLTAICMQSPAMIGLIFTGKSIARFPELKEPKFAEYFLIGTFLSLAVAIAGGLILLFSFHGTISLK